MFKAIDKWLIPYLQASRRRVAPVDGTRHLLFCIADHFEPFRGGASEDTARRLVDRWCSEYPTRFQELTDADGRPPRHTFFYAGEDYHAGCLSSLGALCSDGFGEVEIQLHHRGDTPESLARKLVDFRDQLVTGHGMLGRDADGEPRFGFVHGNWALCNSRPDGDWCGVDEELAVLRETGCFADFTFPSVPSETQPRVVNSIYYAHDIAGQPRGHDRGTPVLAGKSTIPRDNELMLIQGPLALNWHRRKWGVMPRIENGEITPANMLTPDRIDLGVRQEVAVAGRSDWVVLKIHTHGCLDGVIDRVLGEPMQQAHEYLRRHYNDGSDWRLHYVSARELYNIVKAAEAGKNGDPGAFLNYAIKVPEMR
jgi:hypothetical protein